MQAECPICNSWSKEKYILRAQKEKDRLDFWLPYCEDYEEACRAVCDNSPGIDRQWKEIFPNPAAYRKMVLAQKKAELAATTTNTMLAAIKPFENYRSLSYMEIRPEIMRVAEAMEHKLRENAHKGKWKFCPLQYLSMRLTQEKKELIRAVMEKRYQDVLNEAADVCNFAMMIADNYRPNSEAKEAVEQPLTQVKSSAGATAEQICELCDNIELLMNESNIDGSAFCLVNRIRKLLLT